MSLGSKCPDTSDLFSVYIFVTIFDFGGIFYELDINFEFFFILKPFSLFSSFDSYRLYIAL